MPQPIQIGATSDSGIGLYYVPLGDTPPNAFALFWSNFLAQRTPVARQVLAARMAAMSPAAQYKALGDMSRSTEGLVRTFGSIENEQLGDTTALGIEDSQARRAYFDALQKNRAAELGASADVASARIGLEAVKVKEGHLDPPAQAIATEFGQRMAGLQDQLNEATKAGNDEKVIQVTNDIQRVIANAKDQAAAAGIGGLQYDSLARTLGATPLTIQDPENKNDLRALIDGTFGRPGQINVDLPGAGGSALPSVGQFYQPAAPGVLPGASSSRSRAESIVGPAPAARSTGAPSSPSAVQPEPSPERRTGSPGSAPASGGSGPQTTAPSSSGPLAAPSASSARRSVPGGPLPPQPASRSAQDTTGTEPAVGGTGSATQDLVLGELARQRAAEAQLFESLQNPTSTLGGFRDPLPGYEKTGRSRVATEPRSKTEPEGTSRDRAERPSRFRMMAEGLVGSKEPKEPKEPKARKGAPSPSDLDRYSSTSIRQPHIGTGGEATQVTGADLKPEGRRVSKVGPGSKPPPKAKPKPAAAPRGSSRPSGASYDLRPFNDTENAPAASGASTGKKTGSASVRLAARKDERGPVGNLVAMEAAGIDALNRDLRTGIGKTGQAIMGALPEGAPIRKTMDPFYDRIVARAGESGPVGLAAEKVSEFADAEAGALEQAARSTLSPEAPILVALDAYRKRRAAPPPPK